MNQFLNKLERKFGHLAVPDIIYYLIILYSAGAALGLIAPSIYYRYLCLNFNAIFHGQVWRLFTYLLEPYGYYAEMGILVSLLFFAIQVNLFFLFGRSLEQVWGTFRANLYFLSGYLLNIIAALILYLSPLHLSYYGAGFQFIYWSMFFAFATLYPNYELLVWFILPIKVKWLALADAIYMTYLVVANIQSGNLSAAVAIVVAMGNFLIYFFASRQYKNVSHHEMQRRRSFRKKVLQGERNKRPGGTRHRCAVCGRTELDDENLDFRYCSKCEGNFEYCTDHLFIHEHVKKG